MEGDDNEFVGFRFYPTEEELLCFYLSKKLKGLTPEIDRVIPLLPIYDYSPWELPKEELLCFYLSKKLNGPTPEIDRVIPLLPIYDYSPWELPKFAGEVCHGDREQWFFFTAMQEREARGGRPNRLTENGYWKATGSPSDVFSPQNLRIGRKKTLVFYEGRAPYGSKTTWKMNDYKLYDHSQSNPQLKEEVSLCRIYKRSKFPRAFDRRPVAQEAAVQLHQSSDEAIIPVDVENDEFDRNVETHTQPLRDSDIQTLLHYFDL